MRGLTVVSLRPNGFPFTPTSNSSRRRRIARRTLCGGRALCRRWR